jgi:hypothetical protein
MPTTPDPDELSRLVQRVNQEQNGNIPIMGPTFKPRPSGWICPTCHTEAEQRAEPAPGTITGIKWLFEEDGVTPQPVAVITEEVLQRDDSGKPVRTERFIHCFTCFNIWQKRKMMQDIRANVSQLVRKADD